MQTKRTLEEPEQKLLGQKISRFTASAQKNAQILIFHTIYTRDLNAEEEEKEKYSIWRKKFNSFNLTCAEELFLVQPKWGMTEKKAKVRK